MVARDYVLNHVAINTSQEGRSWIDVEELECVLTDYDSLSKVPVNYVVMIHSAYSDAQLEFNSPFEAVNFMTIWASHLTYNEGNSITIDLSAVRTDESNLRDED